MADQKPTADSSADIPTSPPQDLYAMSDIRFVMLEIGKLTTKVDRLISDVGSHGEKIDAVRHQVSFVRGALYVIGAIIAVIGVGIAWYFSGKLNITFKPGG